MTKELYDIFLKSSGVNTDSRTIQDDQLYFALTGENFDGNEFVEQALKNGAIHAISNDSSYENNPKITIVPDTLKTLQELATHHRNTLNIPIVALTGSNGKTTTKELILAVLSQAYKVKGTRGNLNNHIGVPLTLLSFDNTTQIGIVEMGANHQLEIAALSEIAKPNYGLITNFGKAHMEGFGGIEGIKKGKSELYDFLRVSGGIAITGSWDTEQDARTQDIKRIKTPVNTNIIENTDLLCFEINGRKVETQLTGVYNYHNALLAYAIGILFDMNDDAIINGISNYEPTNHRSQVIDKGALQLIMDSYNANPSSMEVAIENLANKDAEYKIAILGDMFELGIYAQEEHQKIVNLAQQSALNEIHLIGSNFNKTDCKTAISHESFEEFTASFKLPEDKKATILIKGSRGMALERVLNLL